MQTAGEGKTPWISEVGMTVTQERKIKQRFLGKNHWIHCKNEMWKQNLWNTDEQHLRARSLQTWSPQRVAKTSKNTSRPLLRRAQRRKD